MRSLGSLTLALTLTACGSGDMPAPFSLSWKLVDASAADPQGAPALACTDAGVKGIQLTFAPPGATAVKASFDCTLGSAVSQPLRRDQYTILAQAVDASGTPLAQTTFQQDNLNGPTDLGLIVFQIKK